MLVLGGTRFVGRHIANALLAAGVTVTLFNRGITDPVPGADVGWIRGDRRFDLDLLSEARFDAVIDTCGYTPNAVEQSARFLEDKTSRYVFISSVSVYDPERAGAAPLDEDAPVQALPEGADPCEYRDERYGALKALCESRVVSTYRHRATIVRPGLVAGPFDHTDRFTYWPLRIAAGGRVLAPESPAEPIQYIDARDLAAFVLHLVTDDAGGIFNAVTEPGTLTFGDLFDAARRASGSAAEAVWVRAEWLAERDVTPWGELPLWIPAGDQTHALANVSPSRALRRGLRLRALGVTVRDTLAWALPRRRLGALRAGLSPAREADLLSTIE